MSSKQDLYQFTIIILKSEINWAQLMGELAGKLSYIWTGWVREITDESSRLQETYQLVQRNLCNIPTFYPKKPKDVSVLLVRLGNTRILTDNVQKSPDTGLGTANPGFLFQFSWLPCHCESYLSSWGCTKLCGPAVGLSNSKDKFSCWMGLEILSSA